MNRGYLDQSLANEALFLRHEGLQLGMAAQPFLPWPSTFTTDFTTTVFTMTPLRQVLFVPHGSPMMALNPGAAGAALSALGVQLGTPRAIVVVSPHWDTALHRGLGHPTRDPARLWRL